MSRLFFKEVAAITTLMTLIIATAISAGTPPATVTSTTVTQQPQHLTINASEISYIDQKDENSTVSITGKQGGDDIASAVVISDLGWGGTYQSTGTTVGYSDDYDESCPESGSFPDVVYSYTPASNQIVDILLCQSSYLT